MGENEGDYIIGKKLIHKIERAGFLINYKKTRIQYKNSRQDVTGLVVNKKPSVKSEYWRTVRSKCNALFKYGRFTTQKNGIEVEGNINELEGQLNFIDQVDHYNRMRQNPPLTPEYALKIIGKSTKILLSGRERIFSQFLFYKFFVANEKVTILCEGKTDNIYLKSAISELVREYPSLAFFSDEVDKNNNQYKKYNLLVNFIKYSKRTRFFLELFGGADYLKGFIENYEENKKPYKIITPKNPVIIFLDNDDGPKEVGLFSLLSGKKFVKKISLFPEKISPKIDDIRKAQFIHVTQNLYVIFTPLDSSGNDTDIEYFFDDKTRLMKHSGKCFNTVTNRNGATDLSKDAFATHIVKANKTSIDFNSLKPLLDSIVSVIKHYDSIK